MSVLQKFLVLFGFFFLLIQLLFLVPEQVDVHDLSQDGMSNSESSPEQIMSGVRLFEKREDKEDWELTAETAEAFAVSENWKLKKVAIIFYGKQLKYNVTSDEAEINTTSMNIKVLGDINMKTSNDYEFQTEFLNYVSKSRELDSPTRTKLVSPPDKNGKRMQLEADKIIAALDENQAEASGNVYATKKEKKSDVVIHSDEATFHLDTHYSQFMNNVKINYHTSVMEGPLASLKFDETKNALTELVMSGGAVLNDQNRHAVAETMSIQFIQDLFLLTGNPRVIQNGDELIGNEILLLNGGKQIQVKGAKAQIEDVIGK
ncbi:MAG: LPS export ABC transporter periplasmic protein LptC, partial [Bdellovibrionales bacterium]|nr:LPS export ABC transporter periplasmic protein LptC [Bdellovibrionales bacterium]